MTSYIVTGRTEDGSVWATGSTNLAAFNKITVSWGGSKEQATPYSEHVAKSIIDDAPDWVYKLKMIEIDISTTISKCGLDAYDVGRIHEKTHVMITFPPHAKSAMWIAECGIDHPLPFVHDTGKRIWVGSCYSVEWPEEVKPVGDGSDKGYDTEGNCMVSIPVGWCTFYTEQDAENIVKCIEADQTLLSYM